MNFAYICAFKWTNVQRCFAYAQADLRLCWSHIPHCWKSHVTAQLLFLVSFLVSNWQSSSLRKRTHLEVIKLFPCSTQLSMKFQLLIKTKKLNNNDFKLSYFKLSDVVFIMLINVNMPTIVGI